MSIPPHPSLKEIREAMSRRGAKLACTICSHEDFEVVEATLRGTGQGQYFGNRRLIREQIICQNCGLVLSFELERLM